MTVYPQTRLGRLLIHGPVSTHTHATGEVTIGGLACHRSLPAAVHFREQIAALAENPDEPVIPVMVTDGWSGYGRALSALCEPLSMTTGHQRYTVTVGPVRNASAPVIESALLTHLRSNVHGANATYVHGVPGPATAYSWQPTNDPGNSNEGTRATAPDSPAAGGARFRRVLGAGNAGETIATWSVPPDGYYAGGTYAERQVGPDWHPLVGRRPLPTSGNWRIGNGLARVSLTTAGRIAIDWWRPDSAGWVPRQEFQLRRTNDPVTWWTGFTAAEVTELSAHRVTVRVTAATTTGRGLLWVHLRRGTRTVYLSTDYDVNLPHAAVQPVPAAEVLDEGLLVRLVTSPPSSSGFRWLYMTSAARNVSPTNGIIGPAVNTPQWSFGLTAQFNNAADTEGLVNTAREWYTPVAEQVTIP